MLLPCRMQYLLIIKSNQLKTHLYVAGESEAHKRQRLGTFTVGNVSFKIRLKVLRIVADQARL